MLPVVLIVVSGIIWSLAQVLVRKLSRDSGLLVLRNNAIFSLPQLLVCTYLLEHDHLQQIQSASALQWALLAFVGIVGFYLAYAAWFSLLRRVPVDEAAPFVLLMTPFGLLTAVLFLHERMSPAQIVGAVILMAGLAIVTGWLPSQQKTPA
jgi:O-acetylserine/cysteine efflux transporter